MQKGKRARPELPPLVAAARLLAALAPRPRNRMVHARQVRTRAL